MADLATIADVENNWRSLRPQAETILASSLLSTASAALRIQFTDIDTRIAASDHLADLVRGVVAMAVVRVLRGKDPNDPAQYDAIFFTKSELNSIGEESSTTGLPQGAFPDVVTYPVF